MATAESAYPLRKRFANATPTISLRFWRWARRSARRFPIARWSAEARRNDPFACIWSPRITGRPSQKQADAHWRKARFATWASRTAGLLATTCRASTTQEPAGLTGLRYAKASTAAPPGVRSAHCWKARRRISGARGGSRTARCYF
ncbi:hypothetical protein SDC9_116199 [bioreactor metagenome]|uniref:Uncharacterized protein n=1 Tax=bioreactor metagenome TaxID=1076179 RepID=A0A645BVH6_9ZZZZ